ncbi:hypothetical protein MSG28_009026, partial [Choristoneura fumiferana]
ATGGAAGDPEGRRPHHRLELDVTRASGAFSLTFLDGLNNVYRDVQSVVARLSARGGPPQPAPRRAALLINCHYDTVPDSPGASDDGAGCAVALETLRALAASRAPLAHAVCAERASDDGAGCAVALETLRALAASRARWRTPCVLSVDDGAGCAVALETLRALAASRAPLAHAVCAERVCVCVCQAPATTARAARWRWRRCGAGGVAGPAGARRASDDGAGCAVALETLRALAASRAPLAHAVCAERVRQRRRRGLRGGAGDAARAGGVAGPAGARRAGAAERRRGEHNAGVARVRDAAPVGARGPRLREPGGVRRGGREVLFQAGPGLPWLLAVYARQVPRPFASSLAQELFQSGLIPADTDFRVFRDFGNLSGAANGYVYHTRLDTASRAPPAALQRTGDNVLALARGVLESGRLGSAAGDHGAPVFFDVLGLAVVLLGARAAAAAALALLAAVAAALHLHATAAQNQLYMSRSAWWWLVGGELARQARGAAAGVAAAAATGLALHALGARLAGTAGPGCWRRCTPARGADGGRRAAGDRRALQRVVSAAVAVSWLAGGAGAGAAGGGLVRGWWRVRLAADAVTAGWALVLLACCLGALRSGFVAALWAGGGAAGALAAAAAGARGGGRGPRAGATGYVALDALAMFVPVAGRAGPGVPDAVLGALAAALALAAGAWLRPLAAGAAAGGAARALLVVGASTALLVALGPLHAPYSASRPQRVMLFHTRRTDHVANTTESLFWMPALDPNSPGDLGKYGERPRCLADHRLRRIEAKF